MNTTAKGTVGERKSAAWLRGQGGLVSSRRHEPGPGDLVWSRLAFPPQLIEAKCSSRKRGPYADFPPADRAALVATAREVGAVPLLHWWPDGQATEPTILGFREWPEQQRQAA